MTGSDQSQISPPLFLFDGCDLASYSNLEMAERDLEPWTYADDNLQLFDSTGRLLKLKSVAQGARIAATDLVDADGFRIRLVQFLTDIGCYPPEEEASQLSRLVEWSESCLAEWMKS